MNINKVMYLALFAVFIVVITFLLSKPAPSEVAEPIPTPAPTPMPTSPAEDMSNIEEPPDTAYPLDAAEATELMYQLAENNNERAQEAMDQVLAAQDERFIAVFIELFRGRQIGLVRALTPAAYIDALETLSGASFGLDWPAWIEWYGSQTQLTPPPDFTTWKGQLLSEIDPRFADFLQESYPSRIRVEEIQWGGVQVDGIPPLHNPRMLTADKATYMNPSDPIFGLFINEDARAYPLRIVDWHEMANDVVGGVPVSLAYCTLCGAAVAYDGRASDGNTYTFGTSGFLFRSNKLMYDQQTRTLWNQLTGEPVLGPLADTDVSLPILPVVLTTWEEWQNKHPDTLVVDIDTGFSRDYTPGAAYGDYFAAADTMFPVWQRSDLLATKDQIFALRIDGLPKAYPLDILTEEQVVNDTVGDTAVVLVAPRGTVTVEGSSLRAGAVTYSAGGEVRAYERGEERFQPGTTPDTLVDEQGQVWQITEDAIIGPDGTSWPRLGGHLAYWFGWFAFFPQTLVYEG